MTVTEYAVLHGVSQNAVYHAIYARRIVYTYIGSRLDVPDVPFPENSKIRKPTELTELPDYILALIWFNSSICGDSIVVRNADPYVISAIAENVKTTSWSRVDTNVAKITGVQIVKAFKDMGFTGKKDTNRNPPPIEPLPLAKAYIETHASLTRFLQHDRTKPGRENGYYKPCVKVCAAPAVVESLVFALQYLDIAPYRRVSPAANGKSVTVTYTSLIQLQAMHSALSVDFGDGTNSEFWKKFEEHISQEPIPYTVARRSEILEK